MKTTREVSQRGEPRIRAPWWLRVLVAASLVGAGTGQAWAQGVADRDARDRAETPLEPAGVRSPEADAGHVYALRLEHAPFPALSVPGAVVYVPPGLHPGDRLSVVVFVHGWDGCASAVASDEAIPCRPGGPRRGALGLVSNFRASGVRALLVVPQMALERRSSASGRWSEPGEFRLFLQEVLDALVSKIGDQGVDDLDRVIVAAHSGGYVTALTLLDRGEVPIDQVVFYDAFYNGMPQVAEWVEDNLPRFDPEHPRPLRFASVYREGGVAGTSRALARRLQPAFAGAGRAGDLLLRDRTTAPLTEAEVQRPVCLVRVPGDHQQTARHNFVAMLRGSGLPM